MLLQWSGINPASLLIPVEYHRCHHQHQQGVRIPALLRKAESLSTFLVMMMTPMVPNAYHTEKTVAIWCSNTRCVPAWHRWHEREQHVKAQVPRPLEMPCPQNTSKQQLQLPTPVPARTAPSCPLSQCAEATPASSHEATPQESHTICITTHRTIQTTIRCYSCSNTRLTHNPNGIPHMVHGRQRQLLALQSDG
jgi:hypothetical protein